MARIDRIQIDNGETQFIHDSQLRIKKTQDTVIGLGIENGSSFDYQGTVQVGMVDFVPVLGSYNIPVGGLKRLDENYLGNGQISTQGVRTWLVDRDYTDNLEANIQQTDWPVNNPNALFRLKDMFACCVAIARSWLQFDGHQNYNCGLLKAGDYIALTYRWGTNNSREMARFTVTESNVMDDEWMFEMRVSGTLSLNSSFDWGDSYVANGATWELNAMCMKEDGEEMDYMTDIRLDGWTDEADAMFARGVFNNKTYSSSYLVNRFNSITTTNLNSSGALLLFPTMPAVPVTPELYMTKIDSSVVNYVRRTIPLSYTMSAQGVSHTGKWAIDTQYKTFNSTFNGLSRLPFYADVAAKQDKPTFDSETNTLIFP